MRGLFGLFGRRRLASWTPDGPRGSVEGLQVTAERHVLKVFVSHREQADLALQSLILSSLRPLSQIDRSASIIEDGAPWGSVAPDIQAEARIAKTIGEGHIVFVPLEAAGGDDRWIKGEAERAARFQRPTVFLSDDPDSMRWHRYGRILEREKVPVQLAASEPRSILRAAREVLRAQ